MAHEAIIEQGFLTSPLWGCTLSEAAVAMVTCSLVVSVRVHGPHVKRWTTTHVDINDTTRANEQRDINELWESGLKE